MTAAFPPGLALATVTVGPVLATDGTPQAGVRVLLKPEWELIHAATGTRVLAGGAAMVTGPDGTGSVQVVRSDAAGLTRPNPRYTVTFSGPWGTGPLPEPFPLYINQPMVDLEATQPADGDAGVSVPVAVGPGVAPGGLAGQVLAKASEDDFDTTWVPATTGGGSAAVELAQATPSASWSLVHALGRRPAVAIYVGGVLVDADVTATATAVSVVFPTPTAGTAVLT